MRLTKEEKAAINSRYSPGKYITAYAKLLSRMIAGGLLDGASEEETAHREQRMALIDDFFAIENLAYHGGVKDALRWLEKNK